MADLYCDYRVSKTALNRFLSCFTDGKDELHTFSLYENNRCIIRLAPAPYSSDDKREIYSLSKSFCSTAIGMLIDDGRLSPDDRIVDIFPDKCPDEISENLAKMKVRHVLSMNTGHENCVMPKMITAEDAVHAFLSQPVAFTPGTHFTYNTGATCLLSCIVTKITGQTLFDFLTDRLFRPLSIDNARWNRVFSGQNEGGCGLHVSNDDIAKLGLLYINGGVYNGKRLLSEKWVKEASSYISDNSSNGSPDWCSGYGYQFWLNSREGYRGDGAFGQLCFILPDRNIVVAVQSELCNFQRLIDKLSEFIEHLYDKDTEENIFLPEYPAAGSECSVSGLEAKLWKFEKNPIGWTNIELKYNSAEKTMTAYISDGCESFDICAGNGFWTENSISARRFKPKLVGLMSADEKENCRFAASYSAKKNNIHFAIRYLNCPHRMAFDFTIDKKGVLHLYITPKERLYEGSSELTAKI